MVSLQYSKSENSIILNKMKAWRIKNLLDGDSHEIVGTTRDAAMFDRLYKMCGTHKPLWSDCEVFLTRGHPPEVHKEIPFLKIIRCKVIITVIITPKVEFAKTTMRCRNPGVNWFTVFEEGMADSIRNYYKSVNSLTFAERILMKHI